MSNTVIFQDGELDLKVSLDDDTVWLNRHQLSELFDRDIKTIGKHINNVFKEKELEKYSTVANFATVQNEGGREVSRDIEHYNLDLIISIGYRVKSQRGVKFRQWATKILKNYIQDGYVINTHKITEQRLSSIENEIQTIKSHIKTNTLDIKQGIFYDGEVFDAYVFVSDLIKSAKSDVMIIDNYKE
ncbi:MAG: RhuM family protein [Campylobacterota bacterium]|nr:RhuM family protein [Campylobacterota bacterium]